jgi:L-2-hydroxyglutarate oxidase LhgO
MTAPHAESPAVVIGAGVIGMASAVALARAGHDPIVIECEEDIGRGQTSRNSEVVHAGLYYQPGSLKAECCVRGRALLYERCARLGLPHRQLGKWVVACEPAEEDALARLLANGQACGVGGLSLRSGSEFEAAAPGLRASAALFSAETGIVDAAAFTRSLQAELEELGGGVALGRRVVGLDFTGGRFEVHVEAVAPESGGLPPRERFDTHLVVNAAGIDADRISMLAGLDVDACDDRHFLFKGDYFALRPGLRWPVQALVYPVPGAREGGLGIHATLDLAGGVRFGPDAERVESPRYDIDPAKAEVFARAVRRYWPGLPDDALVPAYAGLRPKRSSDPGRFMDFVVREEGARGRPGLIQCIGIESPGLTSSLALAEKVVALAG